MKRSNALFIALTGASLVLIGAIMTDNIISLAGHELQPTVSSQIQNESASTAAIRQTSTREGLSLHPGKYWKASDE